MAMYLSWFCLQRSNLENDDVSRQERIQDQVHLHSLVSTDSLGSCRLNVGTKSNDTSRSKSELHCCKIKKKVGKGRRRKKEVLGLEKSLNEGQRGLKYEKGRRAPLSCLFIGSFQ